jgi:ATP-dependent exoDNAse (exonuclease V) alpha subunit
MPFMITQNYDVQGGIVNGTMGIVKEIRYSINELGERCAKSCVVYVPDMVGPALPNLPPKHAAALAETVDMTFKHSDSHRKCVIRRTQLPLVPAFAMTAHKAKGQTTEAVVDLESTRGTESPYVMLSRAKSLDGVFILGPFRLATIQRHPSQDVRNEFKRLGMLSHQTVMGLDLLLMLRHHRNTWAGPSLQPLCRPKRMTLRNFPLWMRVQLRAGWQHYKQRPRT